MSNQTPGDRFLELDSARLRWRLEGAGPALVLLHGWALDLDYWDPLVELLAPRFTLLRFDRRGFGLSTGLPDIHRNVGDLCAVMDAAGVERAAVLGMSQGARLALHFARARAARARALLLDGAPAFEAEPELPLAGLRQTLQTAGADAMRTQILALPLMRLENRQPAALAILQKMIARYAGLDLLHPLPHALAPDLAEIRMPACVINGASDSTIRLEAGRMLQKALTGSQRIELAGAGHLALLDDPAAYAGAVSAFCLALPS